MSPSTVHSDANRHAVQYVDKTKDICAYLDRCRLPDGKSKGIRIEENGYAVDIVPFLEYSQNGRPSVTITHGYFLGYVEWLAQRNNRLENNPYIVGFDYVARQKLFPLMIERGHSVAHPKNIKFTLDLTQGVMTFEFGEVRR